jgi:hypothetical protein
MIRWIAALALVASVGGVAHAERDAIALLPLDTEPRLEIYSQPVATEIARTLKDVPDIEVLVVGAKAMVPTHARLVVIGKMTSKPGDQVQVTLFVRNPQNSKEPESVSTTSSLEKIDRAAAELAGQLVPILHKQLAALPRTTPPHDVRRPPDPVRPTALQPILVGVASLPSNVQEAEPLRAALSAIVPPWLAAHRRASRPVEAAQLAVKSAGQTVRTSGVDRGIALEVIGYAARVDEKTKAVFAKAKVRLRVADGGGVLFDRVIVTDTIVAKPNVAPERLLELTAQEVLAIARPHMKRVVPAW